MTHAEDLSGLLVSISYTPTLPEHIPLTLQNKATRKKKRSAMRIIVFEEKASKIFWMKLYLHYIGTVQYQKFDQSNKQIIVGVTTNQMRRI